MSVYFPKKKTKSEQLLAFLLYNESFFIFGTSPITSLSLLEIQLLQ